MGDRAQAFIHRVCVDGSVRARLGRQRGVPRRWLVEGLADLCCSAREALDERRIETAFCVLASERHGACYAAEAVPDVGVDGDVRDAHAQRDRVALHAARLAAAVPTLERLEKSCPKWLVEAEALGEMDGNLAMRAPH